MVKLKTYKILSTLLLYPQEECKLHINEVNNILLEECILKKDSIEKLSFFINYVNNNTLLSLQENYVSLFDRQKQFSLYLFEHIHGDSRDRGMAMVDLKNLYKKSGFDISLSKELPDYIPLFLEYLSILDKENSSILLGEIINIIAILCARLELIKNPYFYIFLSIESLSVIKSDNHIVRKALSKSKIDEKSNGFIDKNWEDTSVF